MNATQTARTETRRASRLSPHERRDLIPPQGDARYQELKVDIAKRGIQVPLCVTPDGRVLCGHHRLKAAKGLGIQEVPVGVLTGLDAEQELAHMLSDNLNRRHLNPSQRAALVTRCEFAPVLHHLEEQAHQKQVEGGRAGGRKGGRWHRRSKLEAQKPQVYSMSRGPQVRDLIGHFAGVSGRFITDALFVWAHAPERMEPVLCGEPRPTITALARQIRLELRDGGQGLNATAMAVAPPPKIEKDGDYEANLEWIAQPTDKDLEFVWVLAAGEAKGAVILHKIAYRRDAQGRVGPNTALAGVLRGLGRWKDGGAVDLNGLRGTRHTLSVLVGRTGVRVAVRRIWRGHGTQAAGETESTRARREREGGWG